MHLNKTIESFYLALLDYAGLEVDEDNNIVNKSKEMGAFTLDKQHLALPYFEIMKNPEGRRIFHLLHENYTNPETVLFTQFQRKLTLEINISLQQLLNSLVVLASDPIKQQKVSNQALVDIITEIGEVDVSMLEPIGDFCKASQKVNDTGYLVDIYLKKNGSVGDTPYSAIGKVNFKAYKEIQKGLAGDTEPKFSVFGYRSRKKDLLLLDNLFNIIFPNLTVEEEYSAGTDNKIFRYLNALISTTYILSNRINEIASLLEELDDPMMFVDDIKANLDWVQYLEPLYGLADEIRLIPNQNDIRLEAKKLHLDESKAKAVTAPQPQPVSPPTFNPSQAQQPVQQPIQQPVQQVQQPLQTQQVQESLSPEEIIRGRMGQNQNYLQQQQMMMNQMNPMQMQVPAQQPVPSWVQQEMGRGYQPQMGVNQFQQQMGMQPQMMNQFQQPMMNQMNQFGMQQQFPQQQGMELNPHLRGRVTSPWG